MALGGATQTGTRRQVRKEQSSKTTVEDRPPSPFTGQTYRNSETGVLEVFNGQEWVLQEDEEGLQTHISDTSNPHVVTAGLIGLGNVNNTSDADKPVSTATQTALDLKAEDFASTLNLDEGAGAPSTVAGRTQIYSDGTDLKVLFGDGTTKTVTLV